MFFVNALIIMEGCVSILQSIQSKSSPVDAELVDAVEVAGCKETEQNKLKTDDKSHSGATVFFMKNIIMR